jgi:hypothetical protein
MKTDAETLWSTALPPSASVVSSWASRNRAADTFDAGETTIRLVRPTELGETHRDPLTCRGWGTRGLLPIP